MKVVQFEEFGAPEVMHVAEISPPTPDSKELLIEVRASGVNRVDILTRSGAYHQASQLPMIPGLEVSGVVLEAGSEVVDFKAGDRVLASEVRPGGYAEQIVAAADRVVRIPEAVNWDAAVALPTAWLTAWYCMRNLAQLEAGETVLIQAAASGVGDAAMQIAKFLGAKVIAATGSDEKVSWSLKNGADWGINYEEQDIVEEIQSITEGKGVEVVMDVVGGRIFPASLKAVGHGGRVVALANVTTEDSVVNTRDFYPKNATIYGFQIINLKIHTGYDPRPDLKELLRLVADGKLRVHVDRSFSLANAAEAHRYLEQRQNRGKVVLKSGG